MIEWDNDKELRLIAMRREGRTFLECAAAFGTTRSAIAGKCKRLGLSGEKPAPAPAKPKRQQPSAPTFYSPKQRNAYEELRKAVENTK